MWRDEERRREAGITLFLTVHRREGQGTAYVAAAHAPTAEQVIHARYGADILVDVVAASAYLEQSVPWLSWRADGRALTVLVDDITDDSGLSAVIDETDDEVVVTVSGPRWQGLEEGPARSFERTVNLSRPVSRRRVIDGATGLARPSR